MRTRPEPGTYVITIDGKEYPATITTQGFTTSFDIFGAIEWSWVWQDIEGGPILVGPQPYVLTFTPPDTFHVIGPNGITAGHYRKIT